MNWLNYYQENFKPFLNVPTSAAKRGLAEGMFCRADGFELMFKLLLDQRQNNFKIIETGTIRRVDNWKDGQSARLFTEMVDYCGGSVRSVDIDEEACMLARQLLPSKNFTAVCSDSVDFLKAQSDLNEVDLFYLDSWNVKWANDGPSADHHLKEFLAIEPFLKSGAVVAIDDNCRRLADNSRTGKGRRIVEYLGAKGIQPVYDQYQIIYQF